MTEEQISELINRCFRGDFGEPITVSSLITGNGTIYDEYGDQESVTYAILEEENLERVFLIEDGNVSYYITKRPWKIAWEEMQ